MKTTGSRIIACLAGLLFSLNALADEVIMRNGDRLTGTIRTIAGDRLVINIDYAGEVRILLSEIRAIRTDKPVDLVLDDDTRVRGKLSVTDGTEMLIRDDSHAAPRSLSMAQIASINPPPELRVRISGRFNAGFERNRGNTDNDKYHFDTATRLRWAASRLNLNADGDLERTNNRKSKEKASLAVKYDYFFDKEDYLFHQKWYLWSAAGFEHDRFADLSLRTTVGLGPGYQIFENERTHLSVEGGPSYIWENFESSEDQDYAAVSWGLDFRRQLFSAWKLEAFHNHHLRWSIEDSDRYVFNSELGLRIPILDRIQATIQFDFDRNNAPAPDAKKNDYDTMVTGGYTW